MHIVLGEFRLSTAFRSAQKKSEGELNFLEKSRLLREKPTIVAFLNYRLSSALLDFEGEIWRNLFTVDLSLRERHLAAQTAIVPAASVCRRW